MSRRVLTPDAQWDSDQFDRDYSERGCSCHISPPCSHCTHPGHPLCLEEDETAWTWETWGDMLDDLEHEAKSALARFIDKTAARHMAEMAVQKGRP